MKGIIYNLVLLITLILLLESCTKPFNPTKEISLPSIFSDNMVLQADKEIMVWGKIDPNMDVKVWIDDNNSIATSDSSGNFTAKLDEMKYGGPYTLSLAGMDTIVFENVMIGEVWVCSGQSNMQWQVSQSEDAPIEIESADYENIRLFTVPRKVADEPQDDCIGEWSICSPTTVKNFSAVGYFFGRELHKNLDIPIGLIHSSWGGTPIEAWMKVNTLENDSDFVPIITRFNENLAAYPEKLKEYNELVEKINKEGLKLPPYQIDKGNEGYKKGWQKSDFSDDNWSNAELPGFVESFNNRKLDGAFWFRKKITLPEEFENKDLIIELGAIDDFDITYFNGIKVGSIGDDIPNFWSTPRNYQIKSDLVRKGENVVAVRMFDHFGEGGFSGTPSQMKIYIKDDPSNVVELAGTWKTKIEAELDPKNVTGPGGSNLPPTPLGPGHPHSPAGLYNAMIHPLAPFSIKGFIWYQGEANANRAYQYRKLLPAMIKDWRDTWVDQNLYFGIVQLANFMAIQEDPSESAWAELREAQFLASNSDLLNGLAVTIDIGEADDIHPRNKQDVGKRLAYWALSEAYEADSFNNGTNLYTGPIIKDYKTVNDEIHVQFDNYGEELIVKGGGELLGFAIAGNDQVFHWANAEIVGNKIVLSNEKVKNPIAARYAWANNPKCNLYDSSGLPASPFRTDNWVGVTDNAR